MLVREALRDHAAHLRFCSAVSRLTAMRTAPVFPYQQQVINAGSAAVVPWTSATLELAAAIPTQVRWRYDNLTDGVVLQDWQTLATPSETRGTITIPASLNAMTRQYRDKQLNQVTFEITTADGVRQQLAYVVLGAVFTGVTS
jgi:hypothetical protein